MHIHANHVYITYVNGVCQANPIWVDVYTVNPMDVVDYVVPYMRPPDIPNERGIGRADAPLLTNAGGLTWPPNEELNTFHPDNLTAGTVDLRVQLSPLCYPMHDHSEPSQTAQGGNYNMGMISGCNFIGDRNTAGDCLSFPNQPHVYCLGVDVETKQYKSGVYPPTVPPPWF